MKKYFKDFYGSTASITESKNGFKLRVCDGYGRLLSKGIYATERGAKISMGKLSDCWKETK